ncbi:MAG: YhcN/YlaJ family sporulation lipoprotein [Clostridia bacterium]|nr:YhcN/YlaJ family sporulation lipoprotein [Clostridia bacterium]
MKNPRGENDMKKNLELKILVLALFAAFAMVTLTGCPIPQQRPLPPGTNQPPPGAQPERNVEEPPINHRIPDNRLALRVAEVAGEVDGVTEVSVVVVGTTAFIGIELAEGADGEAVERTVEERVEQQTMIVEALASSDPEIIKEIDNIRTGAIPPNAVGRLFDRMQEERRGQN